MTATRSDIGLSAKRLTGRLTNARLAALIGSVLLPLEAHRRPASNAGYPQKGMAGRGRGWSLSSLLLRLPPAYGASAPGIQRRRLAHMSRPLATVHRLRPRNRQHVELLQEALDLGGWSEPTRVELNQRLTTRLPDAVEPWSFAMVAASRETVAAFLREIGSGPRAFATLAVWYALAPYVRRDTADVICSQRTLARTAGVSLGDVHRALARLVEMGVLLRESHGRYRVHPAVMWK